MNFFKCQVVFSGVVVSILELLHCGQKKQPGTFLLLAATLLDFRVAHVSLIQNTTANRTHSGMISWKPSQEIFDGLWHYPELGMSLFSQQDLGGGVYLSSLVTSNFEIEVSDHVRFSLGGGAVHWLVDQGGLYPLATAGLSYSPLATRVMSQSVVKSVFLNYAVIVRQGGEMHQIRIGLDFGFDPWEPI